jgi:hypothetical protein
MPLANLPVCLVSGSESITNESIEPLGNGPSRIHSDLSFPDEPLCLSSVLVAERPYRKAPFTANKK